MSSQRPPGGPRTAPELPLTILDTTGKVGDVVGPGRCCWIHVDLLPGRSWLMDLARIRESQPSPKARSRGPGEGLT